MIYHVPTTLHIILVSHTIAAKDVDKQHHVDKSCMQQFIQKYKDKCSINLDNYELKCCWSEAILEVTS